MHNKTHSAAPTTLYNCTKLEFYSTPYKELALDRWMRQNSPIHSPNAPFLLSIGKTVYNLANVLLKHHLVKLIIV